MKRTNSERTGRPGESKESYLGALLCFESHVAGCFLNSGVRACEPPAGIHQLRSLPFLAGCKAGQGPARLPTRLGINYCLLPHCKQHHTTAQNSSPPRS